jgi:hypothetical protein
MPLEPDEPSPSAVVVDGPDAQPIAWRLLLIPAIAQLLLHLLTNGRYGIFRDEYYYLACASHPAWGYVDQPPLSIWILGVWKAIFGDSVAAIRVLPALCGSGLIVLTGAIAAQMGGRRWAQLFAGLAAGVGAAGLVIAGFYSMNAFDLLFWAGAYYLLVRITRTSDGRWWLWLGLLLGIGLVNKIGLLVFGLVLALGLLLTQHRRHFLDRRLWLAGALAAVFLVPYVLWNALHDWPTLEFIENAKRYKISAISPWGFLTESILEANPLTLPLWLGGLVWLLVARLARRFQIAGLMFLLTYVVLVLQKSKPYYFAASFPVLMAAGGVAWESWSEGRRWQWVRWVLAANLIAGGVVFAPMAVPLLSPENFVTYQQRLGIIPNTGEVGHTSALPQYFSDRLGWEELARTVADVYEGLSPEDRNHCVIVARNYGQAGALEYWSQRYELPPVACGHNNYWLWGPPAGDIEVAIVVTFDRETLENVFEEVEPAGEAITPLALESRMQIWLCRGLLQPLPDIWAAFKMYI